MRSATELLHWLKKEEEKSEQLWQLSQEIWKNPELALEEHKAHQILTDFLEERGFHVQRSYHLPTAFRAELALSGTNLPGATVGLLCEYDALPGIGHCCGHNLIAEAGVGAALAIQAAARTSLEAIPGKIVVLGTPAEEKSGGKIQLLNHGAFEDLDAVMMVHPFSGYKTFSPMIITSLEVDVEFHGEASHASVRPSDGRNALDAAVACYVNVALLKQQLQPDWKINGIITKGGEATNVVPRETAMRFLLRAPEIQSTGNLLERFQKCVVAAAESTGCQSQISVNWENFYDIIIQNEVLEEQFARHSQDFGIQFVKGQKVSGSTDFGNVSQRFPGLHPGYGLGTDAIPHTVEFGSVAGSRAAQEDTLRATAALAATALDVLTDPELLDRVKHCHHASKH